jgi:ABC-type lipoprotein export system ATPase subunit
MDSTIVTLNNISRQFKVSSGTLTALNNVSCNIRSDDRITIMGPSGSGKSTLMAMMAGLDEPTTGKVTWPGLQPMQNLRPAHVGLAFQTASLIPSLTALENIEVPLLIMGENVNLRGKAQAVLDAMHLAELADRLPEQLSGGQAQRIAMARAIVAKPRLLLADEPTGQLDQDTGKQLIQFLITWAEQNSAALVIATHDETVSQRMTTVWHMRYGRLET